MAWLAAGCSDCTADADCRNACGQSGRCRSGGCEQWQDNGECDDGLVCTHDACDPEQGCRHTPIGPDVLSALTDLITGRCDGPDPCFDGFCVKGVCTQRAIDCSDGKPCTEDTCSGGKCQHKSTCAVLVDWCATNACSVSGCVVTPGLSCEDGDPCTLDTCDPGLRCEHVALADGATCTAETSGDTCRCEGGRAIACPGGFQCACTADADCDQDLCLSEQALPVCTRTCKQGDCPAGWVCKAHARALVQVCVPEP